MVEYSYNFKDAMDNYLKLAQIPDSYLNKLMLNSPMLVSFQLLTEKFKKVNTKIAYLIDTEED